MVYSSETPKYFLLTILMGIGLVNALFDRLNAKTALWIYSGYFGISILTGVTGLFPLSQGAPLFLFLGGIVINVCSLLVCICFFSGRSTSPVPVYAVSGIYALVGILNIFVTDLGSLPENLYREMFMESAFSLLENLVMLALLTVMAYTLHRKRKLSMK